MSRIANLYALAFALDGALSLLDELLRSLFGVGALSAARAPVAELVLLASAPIGALLALTPRLPWRVLLAPVLFIAWVAFGAMPLGLAVESAPARDLLLSLLQLGIAGATFASMRRATGGESWLLTPGSVRAPAFRFGHTLRAAALGVFAILPALTASGLLSAVDSIQRHTAGFLGFDRSGITLAERRYQRGDREIRLVGMMHVGEEAAYRALFESFDGVSTLVLEEGVRDEDGRLAHSLSYEKFAARLGLDVQPLPGRSTAPVGEGRIAAEDRPGFRNADLDVREFSPATLGFLEQVALAFDTDELVGTLRALGALVQQLDAAEMEAVEEDLLFRRNRNLLRELDAALADHRRVVVPWGALHLPEIERGVVERGFRLEQSRSRRLLHYATIGRALIAAVSGATVPGE